MSVACYNDCNWYFVFLCVNNAPIKKNTKFVYIYDIYIFKRKLFEFNSILN